MRRRCALALALFMALLVSPGCASDGARAQWDEFWKDVRGDNMEMGSHHAIPPLTPPDQ
jgi:hypothetical protein